jgi:hypothetical protein
MSITELAISLAREPFDSLIRQRPQPLGYNRCQLRELYQMWRSFIEPRSMSVRRPGMKTQPQRRRESKECAIQIDHFVVVIDHRNDTPLIEARAWMRNPAANKLAYFESVLAAEVEIGMLIIERGDLR